MRLVASRVLSKPAARVPARPRPHVSRPLRSVPPSVDQPQTSTLRTHFSATAVMTRVTKLQSFDEYKQAVGSPSPSVIDFHAEWCGPCKVISPKFESYSDEYTDLAFYSVDVDDQPEIAQDCKIQAMPTFIVFKDGKQVDSFKGAFPAKLEEILKRAVGK